MVRRFVAPLLFLLVAQSAAAHEGWGIVFDQRGRIYFTDIARNIVWRLDPDGTLAAVLENTHSHALVSIGDGSVYGVHADLTGPIGSVWRIDAEGRVHTLLPPTRDLPLGLQSFLIDTDGSMYSAIRWTPRGSAWLLRRRPDGIAERVAEGFTGIDGMAWAPDGAILLTDGPYLKRVVIARTEVRAYEDSRVRAYEDSRVRAYEDSRVRAYKDSQARASDDSQVRASDDSQVRAYGKTEVETLGGGAITETRWDADLMGVTPDGAGGAFVADFSGGRVLAVGRHSGVALEYAPDFPWSPTGIARDAEGLVILEHLRSPLGLLGDLQVGPYLRLRRVGTEGRVVTLEVLWGTRTWIAAAGLALIVVAAIGWKLRTYHR